MSHAINGGVWEEKFLRFGSKIATNDVVPRMKGAKAVPESAARIINSNASVAWYIYHTTVPLGLSIWTAINSGSSHVC